MRGAYRRAFGVYPDLRNPVTLNEKIQWRKLYDRRPAYTACSDKYRVREYVKEHAGERYLVPLLHTTIDPRGLNFTLLPDRFVMKANHGSGWNWVVRDRAGLNTRRAITTMGRWLRTNFYNRHREWQYKDIEPRILIEALLTDGARGAPVEFRMFCFDGEPRFVEVVTGRFAPPVTVDYYDMAWRHLPITHDSYAHAGPMPRPAALDEMRAVAEQLSSAFSFVRVDLYAAERRIYFSELTFTPCAGLLKFHPREYDTQLGGHWRLGGITKASSATETSDPDIATAT